MSDTVILRTEKLTRTLEAEVPITLVRDISLEVMESEFVAITGPSGSGKSSLLYLLGLLDTPTSGKIWLKGADTTLHDADRLADTRLADLGFIFQFHFLLPEFTALENVMLPMQRLGRLTAHEIEQRGLKLLGDVGLAEHTHKIPRKLSGGQQQRVSIARALSNNPYLIIADEPTGNLDSASSATVQAILKDLAHEEGRAVITVTHDNDFAARADRIIKLVDGRIV
jgi:lipoprotein-releasing system ATP-binding protein